MNAFTVRLQDEAAAKLDRIAEKLDRSRAYVAAQAIEDFIAREEWQLAEIEAGLAEANQRRLCQRSRSGARLQQIQEHRRRELTRRLRWTRRALRRLEAIGDYIAKDSPAAADRVTERLRTSANILIAHPAIGRVGRIAGTRELVMADLPYIIPYRVTETSVEILSVIHTSQRWPEAL